MPQRNLSDRLARRRQARAAKEVEFEFLPVSVEFVEDRFWITNTSGNYKLPEEIQMLEARACLTSVVRNARSRANHS